MLPKMVLSTCLTVKRKSILLVQYAFFYCYVNYYSYLISFVGQGLTLGSLTYLKTASQAPQSHGGKEPLGFPHMGSWKLQYRNLWPAK